MGALTGPVEHWGRDEQGVLLAGPRTAQLGLVSPRFGLFLDRHAEVRGRVHGHKARRDPLAHRRRRAHRHGEVAPGREARDAHLGKINVRPELGVGKEGCDLGLEVLARAREGVARGFGVVEGDDERRVRLAELGVEGVVVARVPDHESAAVDGEQERQRPRGGATVRLGEEDAHGELRPAVVPLDEGRTGLGGRNALLHVAVGIDSGTDHVVEGGCGQRIQEPLVEGHCGLYTPVAGSVSVGLCHRPDQTLMSAAGWAHEFYRVSEYVQYSTWEMLLCLLKEA